MTQGFPPDSEMWINDPQVCRDRDPEWFAKVEVSNFGYNMRKGVTPEVAYRDLEGRKRYIAFLKSHGSPLADG